MHYASSRDRQWYNYLATDPKTKVRRMFSRSVVRQSKSGEEGTAEVTPESRGIIPVEESVTKALQGALDELELAAHDTNGKADHVHMYLCILRAQELGDLTQASRYILN